VKKETILKQWPASDSQEGTLDQRAFIFANWWRFAPLSSLAVSAWSLQANIAGNWIVFIFGVAVSVVNLFRLVVWLGSVVTRYRLVGDQFEFSRFGRRAHAISLLAVRPCHVNVGKNIDFDVSFAHLADVHGAAVDLSNDTRLYLSFSHLKNARSLASLLLKRIKPSSLGEIEGKIHQTTALYELAGQILMTLCLMPVVAVASVFLLVGLRPDNILANQGVFIAIGLVLASSSAGLFLYLVPWYWIGCARWYRLSNQVLHYRTMFTKKVRRYPLNQLESIRVNADSASPAFKVLRFRDGRKLKLHDYLHSNVPDLYRQLTLVLNRRTPLRNDN
jgi:hypothetical protein